MQRHEEYFNNKKEIARTIYFSQKEVYSPYFKAKVILNSDGFHHLQFSSRKERNKNEQIYKFSLLPLGLEILRKSATIQEYRKLLTPIGNKSNGDGFVPMKEVEYWGMIAIIGEEQIKVKTILRRVGNGNVVFWSVMLYSKRKNGNQKLFTEGIENE
jgi:hypothetical protein